MSEPGNPQVLNTPVTTPKRARASRAQKCQGNSCPMITANTNTTTKTRSGKRERMSVEPVRCSKRIVNKQIEQELKSIKDQAKAKEREAAIQKREAAKKQKLDEKNRAQGIPLKETGEMNTELDILPVAEEDTGYYRPKEYFQWASFKKNGYVMLNDTIQPYDVLYSWVDPVRHFPQGKSSEPYYETINGHFLLQDLLTIEKISPETSNSKLSTGSYTIIKDSKRPITFENFAISLQFQPTSSSDITTPSNPYTSMKQLKSMSITYGIENATLIDVNENNLGQYILSSDMLTIFEIFRLTRMIEEIVNFFQVEQNDVHYIKHEGNSITLPKLKPLTDSSVAVTVGFEDTKLKGTYIELTNNLVYLMLCSLFRQDHPDILNIVKHIKLKYDKSNAQAANAPKNASNLTQRANANASNVRDVAQCMRKIIPAYEEEPLMDEYDGKNAFFYVNPATQKFFIEQGWWNESKEEEDFPLLTNIRIAVENPEFGLFNRIAKKKSNAGVILHDIMRLYRTDIVLDDISKEVSEVKISPGGARKVHKTKKRTIIVIPLIIVRVMPQNQKTKPQKKSRSKK